VLPIFIWRNIMKSPINKLSIISLALLLIVLCVNQSSGQSLSVFDVDVSNFPTIRAKFFASDTAGKQILNLSPSDFEVTENGMNRQVKKISCPLPNTHQTVSIAMSIDVSISMAGSNYGEIPIKLAKITAKELCNIVEMPPSEFALQTCNDTALIIKDFTYDKSDIVSSIETLKAKGDNDFVEHLLNPMTGLLNIAKIGKNKRVAVLFGDAWWEALSEEELQQCKDTCTKYNITFYAVIYSKLGTEGNGIKKSLRELADFTSGYLYDGVTTTSAAKDIGLKLQQTTQALDPCEIEWITKNPCDNEINNVNLEIILQNNTIEKLYYFRPIAEEAILEINPTTVKFINPIIGLKVEKKVVVTARNADFAVTNIKCYNEAFSITPTDFVLNEGESIELTVSFTPIDSNYNFGQFEIESDPCNVLFYVIGGYIGKKQTLKLIHPNGGEVFVVGSDTVITWEGIPPSEKVFLEYSTNNGQNWQTITKNASGLTYNWTNIPRPVSSQCLVRISQEPDTNNLAPQIEWQKTYGGSEGERAHSIQQTSDGGFIVAGYTWSYNGDITNNKGWSDVWILKLKNDGSIEWQKTYGGIGEDIAYSIQETSDGGYIVACFIQYQSDDITEIKGNGDLWILKLSIDGKIEWQKTYGGTGGEHAQSVLETIDGGYIVLGSAGSNDGDIKEYRGSGDVWVLKLSIDGKIEWQKTYGGSEIENVGSIKNTREGGYIVAASTRSNDGDITKYQGSKDKWLIKLNIDGKIEWQKTYSGTGVDHAYCVEELSSGGYLLAGSSEIEKSDGPIFPINDFDILKLKSDGNIEWQKTYGGTGNDIAYSIKEVNDGGYIVTGTTTSNNGDVTENKGLSDVWVVKLNMDGNIEWQKTLGGSKKECAYSIQETRDGGYIVAGYTQSKNGDVTENKGDDDIWVIKLAGSGTLLQSDVSDAVFSIVEPIAASRDIDMQQVLVGSAKDSVINEFVSNVGTWKFRVDSIYIQGADASAFSLVAGFPEYYIEPNDSYFGEFRFAPNRVGIHTAEIVIVTQAETILQNIIGEGVEPRLQIVNSLIDFGAIYVGDYVDTLQAVTVKNIGSAPLEILDTKHNYPNDVDFTTLGGGGNFILQPRQESLMDLRFTANSLGRTSGTLEFHYNGVGSPAVVQLFGEGKFMGMASAQLKTIEIEAYAGDLISIPIILDYEVDLSLSSVNSIDVEMEFNPTLLYPQNFKMEIINDKLAKILIKDLPANKSAGEVLGEVQFIVGLGNSETCDITLINPFANGGDADVSLQSGHFRLLGVCYEGGTRLFNANSKAGIESVNPNPAENMLEVDLQLNEEGQTELLIYNMQGEKVKELFKQNVGSLGAKSLKSDISDLSSGQYYLVLITPTYITAKNLVIMR
jgi:hypothetical protein